MEPTVFELAVNADGVAVPGKGLLAVHIPANAGYAPLVVAGCDPRHDPGVPIEGLAAAVFQHIHAQIGNRDGLRWVVVDSWGRFFEAIPHWDMGNLQLPLMDFKRLPGGVGVDAFTKEMGAAGEAALELLSSVIEGGIPEAPPASARQFLEAIELHGNLPAPGALFQLVQAATVSGDINAVAKGIQADPVIAATLINYANAAAFAAAGKTASVQEAIQRLGMNQVRRVVFIAEMMARYQKGACASFDYKAYWYNAVATGASMRGLLADFGIPVRLADDGFTTGLVSGIGWLAIAETFPKLMADYVARAAGLTATAKARLQREVFPAPVAEVTATYLARFDFPESIRSAITGLPTEDGWSWYDCLASAMRVAQSLEPLAVLAIPDNLPIPERCQEEWRNWQSLLSFSS
jgi:HD-like signal output (HDOD) protein